MDTPLVNLLIQYSDAESCNFGFNFWASRIARWYNPKSECNVMIARKDAINLIIRNLSTEDTLLISHVERESGAVVNTLA